MGALNDGAMGIQYALCTTTALQPYKECLCLCVCLYMSVCSYMYIHVSLQTVSRAKNQFQGSSAGLYALVSLPLSLLSISLFLPLCVSVCEHTCASVCAWGVLFSLMACVAFKDFTM